MSMVPLQCPNANAITHGLLLLKYSWLYFGAISTSTIIFLRSLLSLNELQFIVFSECLVISSPWNSASVFLSKAEVVFFYNPSSLHYLLFVVLDKF